MKDKITVMKFLFETLVCSVKESVSSQFSMLILLIQQISKTQGRGVAKGSSRPGTQTDAETKNKMEKKILTDTTKIKERSKT